MLSSGLARRDGLFCDFGSLRRRCSRLLRQGFEWSNSLQRCGGRPLWFLIGHLQQQTARWAHEEDEEQGDRWSGLQFQQVCFFLSESTENRGGAGPVRLQDRSHDSVLQHQDSDPDSLEWSDSVVIEWWTSLCAKTGACVQWLDCSHEVSGVSGFPDFPDCAGVPGQSTLGTHQMATCWENPGRVQYGTGGWRSRKFPRTTRPPTQMQPQAQTARTQQVLSATRMISCFRSDPECRDGDASATGFGPRPLDSGHQGKSEICNQRADKKSGHSL